MRRLALTLLIFGTVVSFAQNVPNGGFEDWETEDYFVLEDWVSYGKPEQTTDVMVGDYALKLVNYPNGNQYLTSSIYNINWTQDGVNKFPYNGDPLSVVFYAKYDLAAGDSAIINTVFYEKGRYSGYIDLRITGTSNGDFIKYSVPITWFTSRTPDSVYIGMKSLSQGDLANGAGYIIIDDFHFENIGKRTVDVLNHDFEKWTNNGVPYPKSWMPIDLVAFREWGGFLRNPLVLKSTPPFRGECCLAIQNFISWNDNGEGGCFTGDTVTHAWRPAFPIAKKYAFLQGYYKLEQGGTDTAEIAFNVFKIGQYLGEGSIKLNQDKTDWTYFSIPVTYYADLIPDSATIRLNSSINTRNNSSTTTLYLDELAFVMEQDNRASLSNLKENSTYVFPNPFNNELVLTGQITSYSILTIPGNIVQEGTLRNGTIHINTQDISPGLYILTAQDINQNQWQQKILKQ
jgi:hypothetical protein